MSTVAITPSSFAHLGRGAESERRDVRHGAGSGRDTYLDAVRFPRRTRGVLLVLLVNASAESR
jgi:hypothetical protein